MAEADDLLLVEWLGVLAELWTAAGKPLEADRLQVYRQSLGEVPLGLLGLAVRRTLRVYPSGTMCFARRWGSPEMSGWRWRIGSRAGGLG